MKCLTILLLVAVTNSVQKEVKRLLDRDCSSHVQEFDRMDSDKRVQVYECVPLKTDPTKDDILGKGGFGKVFRVRHIGSKQEFAMKVEVFDPKFVDKERERSALEFGILSKASGKCSFLLEVIARQEISNESEKGVLMILPLLDDTLEKELDTNFKSKYGVDHADHIKKVVHETLLGLKFMHDEKVVHRDIKPGNIGFINGQVRVFDLGLAAKIGDAEKWGGTERYLEPSLFAIRQETEEKPKGFPKEYLKSMPSLDLYAVGATLYFMLTGTKFAFSLRPGPGMTFFTGLKDNAVAKLPAGTPLPMVKLVVGLLNFDPFSRINMDTALKILADYEKESNLVLEKDASFPVWNQETIDLSLFKSKRVRRELATAFTSPTSSQLLI